MSATTHSPARAVSPHIEASKLFIKVLKARRTLEAAVENTAEAVTVEHVARENLRILEAEYRELKVEAGQ